MQKNDMNIDQILSKYRSICSDLDADIKNAAQKIKIQHKNEWVKAEREQIKKIERKKDHQLQDQRNDYRDNEQV